MSDKKTLAHELYHLERAHQAGALDEAQQARWQDLARQVFARSQEERRRSSRIVGAGKAKVKIGDKETTFDVVDVSWGGLQIKGRGASKLQDGEGATLTSVLVGDAWSEVEIGVKVVRQQGKSAAALRLDDLATPRRQRFFEKAYYPMYLGHLKALAEITD
jgi:hypothetical protein